MEFASGEFDHVIDKGCLDALSTDVDGAAVAESYHAEAFRVLKPWGSLLIVSFARLDIYLPLFGLLPWHSVTTQPLSLQQGNYWIHCLVKSPTGELTKADGT